MCLAAEAGHRVVELLADQHDAKLGYLRHRILGTMRVIFIDFDGVLHATHGRGAIMREYVWLPILKELIATHDDIRLVVHASARKISDAGFLGSRLGLPENVYWGVTQPELDRWPSIQAWLAQRPEIESFRILDDQGFEFPTPPPPELILCQSHQGLSELRVQNALRLWLSRG